MLNLLMTCLLLAAALGLSLRRFALPYLARRDIAEQSEPVTMVASAVFLAALALTVSDKDFWHASLTVAGGIVVALIFDQQRPRLAAVLSAACLLCYLALR